MVRVKPIGKCTTDGCGHWSTIAGREVTVTKLAIGYIDEDNFLNSTFGELRAYFNTSDWNTDEDGLIYTDERWLMDFQMLLIMHGFSEEAALDVEYSEQGLQGHDYVSLDVGAPFLRECDLFFNFITGQLKTVEIQADISR